ncbi:MAG: agmatine deiminase family protein [Acidobacteria bacterium]|nr:agmatine deiminase family protein [Acidobacteriota bacterium]
MGLISTPDGYRMPAEWEPHEATWIAWPHYRADWPGKFAPIPWVFGEVVRHLHRHERVRILVENGRLEHRARRLLSQAGVSWASVEIHGGATTRGGRRDSGRICVGGGGAGQGGMGILDWKFNGWARYSNWRRDDAVPAAIARLLGLKCRQPEMEPGGRRIVLEGGGIDVNGRGTLVATEECLLSPVQARNPGASRAEMEGILRHCLGVSKVIWLGRGIAGDDTHGHVDDIARFVDPTTLVVSVESNRRDANYETLGENRRRLAEATDQDGRPFRVVELPMPRPLFFRGERLPASYANFYIANRTVLVPTFNDPNDPLALRRLSRLFPERSVVGIHSLDLVWGLGTLHCLTLQQPLA